MLAILSNTASYTAPLTSARSTVTRSSAVSMESVEDLKALAVKCNPTIGYYNPLALGETSPGSLYSPEPVIGFLRHAEIKHGRVAMAAFVDFIVQNAASASVEPRATRVLGDRGGGRAGEQWDAPTLSKLQILGFIGLLELWGEGAKPLALVGEKHYMAGGKPGVFPSFKAAPLPHPVPLDLWDPFGFTKKMSDEKKAKSLVAEINNGRLAMIGTMGFMAASKGLIVPGMDKLGIAQYDGEIMAPFAAGDSALPFVSDMLGKVGTLY